MGKFWEHGDSRGITPEDIEKIAEMVKNHVPKPEKHIVSWETYKRAERMLEKYPNVRDSWALCYAPEEELERINRG